jgi:16S rRNA (adenine1518-N6/adenine1519-N6)-dimethyltransferase
LTSAAPLRARQGFRPTKRLGQHFLTEPGIASQIVEKARFQGSDVVVEIGPGRGALTVPLAQRVRHVVAVEKDARLTASLEERLFREGISNVSLVNRDILKWDFHEISRLGAPKTQVIGNLPYNISSLVLEKLVDNRHLVNRCVLMFQSEVAERIAATPGRKAYGAMTVWVQYHARTTLLLEVSREAFYPRPKVDSRVVELDFGRPYPETTSHENHFKSVVKGAFSHRRKTLVNSFRDASSLWNRRVLLEAMEKCRIDPRRRAETLRMDEFLCLASALPSRSGGPDRGTAKANPNARQEIQKGHQP